MSVLKAVEGYTITGVYCSVCDYLITVWGARGNEDFTAAANLHHRLYHIGKNYTTKPHYDVKAEKKVTIAQPVTEIKLQLKVEKPK